MACISRVSDSVHSRGTLPITGTDSSANKDHSRTNTEWRQVYCRKSPILHGSRHPPWKLDTPPEANTPRKQTPPGSRQPPRKQTPPGSRHTPGIRSVRILLECILVSTRSTIFPETRIFHLQEKNPRELLPTFSGLQTSSSQGLFMTVRAWEGITFCVQGIQRVLATNSSVSNTQVKITVFLRLAQEGQATVFDDYCGKCKYRKTTDSF